MSAVGRPSPENLAGGLKSLGEFHDGQAQYFANRDQIQEVEPSLASFIFADKCLLRSYSLCHLILRQSLLFSEFAQEVEKNPSLSLLSACSLRRRRHCASA
jgi:hypothetical protein